MKTELKREFAELKETTPPLYYMAYRVEDQESFYVSATLGEPTSWDDSRRRRAEMRCFPCCLRGPRVARGGRSPLARGRGRVAL